MQNLIRYGEWSGGSQRLFLFRSFVHSFEPSKCMLQKMFKSKCIKDMQPTAHNSQITLKSLCALVSCILCLVYVYVVLFLCNCRIIPEWFSFYPNAKLKQNMRNNKNWEGNQRPIRLYVFHGSPSKGKTSFIRCIAIAFKFSSST